MRQVRAEGPIEPLIEARDLSLSANKAQLWVCHDVSSFKYLVLHPEQEDMVMVECGSCGASNVSGVEKCGHCGAPLAKDAPRSENAARSSDPWMPEITAPDALWTPTSISSDVPQPSGTVHPDRSLFSMAVNIRRIFIVLLTFLILWIISLSAFLYMSVSDDPDTRFVISAIAVAVVVALAGVWYSIDSKRLSG